MAVKLFLVRRGNQITSARDVQYSRTFYSTINTSNLCRRNDFVSWSVLNLLLANKEYIQFFKFTSTSTPCGLHFSTKLTSAADNTLEAIKWRNVASLLPRP